MMQTLTQLSQQLNQIWAGNIALILSVLIAAATLWWTWRQNRRDQQQQRAAQTREELQTIVGDCNRFLRPLGQRSPYPIVHTAAAITKEFCTRLGPSPREEDVQLLLKNDQLVLSICVEDWINSSQVRHMVDLAEDVEHKASSSNLQGKLLLICHATFLLAGLIAKVCSPVSFYRVLCEVKPDSRTNAKVHDILNAITVDLQQRICNYFDDKNEGMSYKEAIERSLYFIQTAAGIFINLKDKKLMRLEKEQERIVPFYPGNNPIMEKIEQAFSLPERFEQVKCQLANVKGDLDPGDYTDLLNLIEPVGKVCLRCETFVNAVLSETRP